MPAFPGAEGFGALSVGGRGGKVLFVTNLNDSGPGSLRAAVESDGPRTVIFRVSGTIALKSNLSVKKPYITIAGQTAPGDGICLKDHALSTSADHVIVRYIRCRLGDNAKSESDALSVSSGQNIIVDHCSACWSVDETLSASSRGQLGNVTVQWCIISESLNNSSHHKGAHGYGSLIRGGFGNGYTFHHNLYAHHHARLPRPGNYNDRSIDPEGFILDFRNNVIYNWGGRSAGYNADGTNKANSITKMNFVGNYYKTGANSSGSLAFSESTKTAKAFFSDNCMNGSVPDDPWSLVTFDNFSQANLDSYKQSNPIPVPPVKTDNAITAYKRILAGCGASLPKRDPVDLRIIKSVKNRTGKIINDESDVGAWPELKSAKPPKDSDKDGMPDKWEKRYGFNSNDSSDRNNDPDKDGYTNLEEYLNTTKP
ncbi:MAG: pectate lyase [Planctomycetes bacterium]|nr:pectate lyase [Planctomycetota bacterium]